MISTIKQKWKTCATLPDDAYYVTVAQLNNDEALILPQRDSINIYKFNKKENKFSTMNGLKTASIHYNEGLDVTIHANKLYLFSSFTGSLKFYIYDLDNNNTTKEWLEKESKILPSNAARISIKDKIHFIGGYQCNKHLIWNPDKDEIITVHEFTEYGEMQVISAVYIPSKQTILAIGGWDDINNTVVGIWRCRIKMDMELDKYKYEWKKLFDTDVFDHYSLHALLSCDQQYVVLAGGWHKGTGASDKIFILDISSQNENEYKINECAIKLPLKGINNLIRFGDSLRDRLLVIGWIKRLFNTKKFAKLNVPPMEIMELISCWYNGDTLHWFSEDKPADHYSIELGEILSSLKQ